MRVPLPTLHLAAALAVAALAGGAVALGGAAVLGVVVDDDSPTTVFASEPRSAPGDQPALFRRNPGPLTIREIYRRAAPGVVQITSTTLGPQHVQPLFGFPLPREKQEAQGSGFVIDESGHVVTNYHVIAGASDIEVSFSNRRA